MIVLNECKRARADRFIEVALIEAFKEKATLIFKDARRQDADACYVRCFDMICHVRRSGALDIGHIQTLYLNIKPFMVFSLSHLWAR